MAAPTTGDDYRPCRPRAALVALNPEWTCEVHGARYSHETHSCQTIQVLRDVMAERARQFAAYGTNEELKDGTGPDVPWLDPYWPGGQPVAAADVEEDFRQDYEQYKRETNGPPTWMHLVREEVAEAFAESDPSRLRAELVQVAALCVSWIEKIDARPQPPAVP